MSDNNYLSDLITDMLMSRRSFMKWSAALGSTVALASVVGDGSPVADKASRDVPPTSDKIVWNSGMDNCRSRCPFRLHVKDGTIAHVDTDDLGEDESYGMH